jgi:DNA-binding response OmpR family regulator
MPEVFILIAQRDRTAAAELESIFHEAAYSAYIVDNSSELVARAANGIAIAILDWEVNFCSGTSVCSELRNVVPTAPVLFILPEGDANRKYGAFEAGADDVLIRPVDRRELILRVEALRRRAALSVKLVTCRIGSCTINFATGQAIRCNAPVSLTSRELQVLRYLYDRRDRLVSRDELLREVWKYSSSVTRTVEVHISTLRKKLESDPADPRHLKTVRGRGYLLLCSEDSSNNREKLCARSVDSA